MKMQRKLSPHFGCSITKSKRNCNATSLVKLFLLSQPINRNVAISHCIIIWGKRNLLRIVWQFPFITQFAVKCALKISLNFTWSITQSIQTLYTCFCVTSVINNTIITKRNSGNYPCSHCIFWLFTRTGRLSRLSNSKWYLRNISQMPVLH